MTRDIRAVGVALLISLLPASAAAEIYRWEDVQGTVHFTDDLTNVPPDRRKDATIIIREPVPAPSAPKGKAPRGGKAPLPENESLVDEATLAEQEIPPGDLAQEIERLRARISAKESLVRAVDEKRSLATNPLRNRFIEPGDLDLYEKYKVELPGDRERLKDLEERRNAPGSK